MLMEGIDTYRFQMLNSNQQQSKTVQNIQDWIGTKKTIENMEYDNFLSPESIHQLKNSGGARENKLIIKSLQKRKVWMGERLRSPQNSTQRKSKISK